MKTFTTLIITLFLIITSSESFSQDTEIEEGFTHLQIERGIGLFDEGKYDEALMVFDSVSKCAPEYWWACYEIALTLYKQEDYEGALQYCRESERLNPDNINTIALLGSILDDMGSTDEAVGRLSGAIDTFPYNPVLLRNLSACYINQQQLAKAEQALFRSIQSDPFSSKGHLGLARINFRMGRLAQAYLAYNMAILMSPETEYIIEFEKAITGKLDSLLQPERYPYPQGVDHKIWDDLVWIMKSEKAFSKDFDYGYKPDYLTARQSLLLFQKLRFTPDDTSIYNQFYVRFFSDLLEKEYYETFINYAFKNTGDEAVAKWLVKNNKKLDDFTGWARNTLAAWSSYGFSVKQESEKVVLFHYNDDFRLYAIGPLAGSPREIKTGEWIFIDADGYIEQKGAFVNDKLDGEWTLFWPDGKVKQQLTFVNDKLSGINKTFYSNGALSGVYPMINGLTQGTEIEYTPSGSILREASYKDDLLHGKVIDYDYDEGTLFESSYIAGKMEGKNSIKWFNGLIKAEWSAVDSLYDGPSRTWYPNGVLESEGSYVKGKLTGRLVRYYPNGSMSSETFFNEDGEQTDTLRTYYRVGKLKTEEGTYKDGRLEGSVVSYFDNGSLKSKQQYRDDKPFGLECYDGTGKVIYNASESNGMLNFRSYYADGVLEAEGKMTGAKPEGKWSYYDPLGRVIKELTFKNGLLSGPQKIYFRNGIIKEEYNCIDDAITGLYKGYHSSGKLQLTGDFNERGRQGEWISYYTNDSIQNISFYVDGSVAGRSYEFSPAGHKVSEEYFNQKGRSVRLILFDTSGQVSQDLQYEYDSLVFESHYASGILKSRKQIVNNQMHGKSEQYYPNGKLFARNQYVYGKLDGVSGRWAHTGDPWYQIPYSMGEIYGVIKYYKNGNLLYADSCEKDMTQGIYEEYYSDGKLFKRISYLDDEKHGNTDYLSPDGALMLRLIYREGTLKAYTYRDNAGEVLPGIPVLLETTEVVGYYPDGNVSARFGLRKGTFHGPHTLYYPGGKIKQESNFEMGRMDGLYKDYFLNGNAGEIVSYRNDERSGTFESWYENGKQRVQGSFLANRMQGEWKYYDNTGKLINSLYFDNDEIIEGR